jgi:hypothetical protein
MVWKALIVAFLLVGLWTVWRIGNEKKVCIRSDP